MTLTPSQRAEQIVKKLSAWCEHDHGHTTHTHRYECVECVANVIAQVERETWKKALNLHDQYGNHVEFREECHRRAAGGGG